MAVSQVCQNFGSSHRQRHLSLSLSVQLSAHVCRLYVYLAERQLKREGEIEREGGSRRFKVWTSLQMVLATATATDLAQIGFATFEAGRQAVSAEHKYCLAIQLKYKP